MIGRGRLVAMALHEVMHHGDERLVSILRAIHDGTQHLQNVRAFRIGNVLVSVLRARRDQAQSHPERTCIVGSDPEIVFFHNAFLQSVPEFNVVLAPVAGHGLLQKQPCGKFGKAL